MEENKNKVLKGRMLSMTEIKIRHLYAGKPDAKDEVDFEGLEEFVKTFVVAETFNIESLINGNNCFITGFKGTGKTALLFFLDNYIKEQDINSCSSFVFFKEEFSDTRREELESISRRILSSVSIEKDALVNNSEFEYIWRWLLFKRIVADNETYNGQLFHDNEEWQSFYKTVDRIKAPSDRKKYIIPRKFKISVPYSDPSTQTTISPEVEINLQDPNDENYQQFISIIDKAESAFANLQRTDIPYYIFIDELEAYYGEERVFKRDLCLIRDLIFTVKRLNAIIASAKMDHTKIMCSVRSEVLNAISRFIVTKELNKVTSGFSLPLTWNYSNTNSYVHPIIQIVLKRIASCEGCDMSNINYKDIYQRWFPEKIHNIEPANYLLNNSWCKPRDMVRFLTVSQNSIFSTNTSFTQAVFSGIIKRYSEDSLIEIKEELRALYDPKQIETIVTCFVGFKTSFSIKQLKQRIQSYFKGTILDCDFIQILNDLYRLGFLGNFLPITKIYRWQHKGDDGLILTDEWRLVVHYALHSALSLGSQQDFALNRGEPPQVGDVATATVRKVIKAFALVEFKHYGEVYEGHIHISEFGKAGYGYIRNLHNIVSVDDELIVVLQDFNDAYQKWNLQISPEEVEKLSVQKQ